jgi:hypothetical protein
MKLKAISSHAELQSRDARPAGDALTENSSATNLSDLVPKHWGNIQCQYKNVDSVHGGFAGHKGNAHVRQ